MTVYNFSPKYEQLPEILPVFPLAGVLLLPRGSLPLNIFEPRYIAMVDAAIRTDRLIGMVQPREEGSLYTIGCAGRITSYNETTDGRYEIVLHGICRFKTVSELDQIDGYRRARVAWSGFHHDMEPIGCLDMDRAKLTGLLKNYFQQHGMTCSWTAVESASDEKLITSLAMICPLQPKEKQALLEAGCCKERAQLFITLLEMATDTAPAARH